MLALDFMTPPVRETLTDIKSKLEDAKTGLSQMAQGWGRDTWGSHGFGAEVISVTLGTLAITSARGALTVDAEANVTPATLAIATGIGSFTFDCEANVTPTTLVTTSAIGSVIIFENEVVNLPTFAITSSLGTALTNAQATATITDSFGITTNLGVVLVWGEIDQSQTPSYSAIDESQTPDWQEVA